MSFADLGLSPELLKAVDASGYTEPTPIQAQAIPAVLMMKDIIGIAQTGTGKTASFVLPMIDILANGRRRARMPRSLILEPTRELAVQVAENFEKYGVNNDLSMALLIGGVQMGDQVKALDEGVDVLIATPGRLMDLFERGKILLTGCELLVIDEADRMLDMGFIPDIEFICSKLPATRQTMLFSATMPPPIEKLGKTFLDNPKRIEVARPASTNQNIAQFKVMVSPRKKREALRELLRTDDVQTAIVFANRKTTVREINKSLKRHGFASGEIHGDMDQTSRLAELELFKQGEINILVASDVAARGLDIKGVSHVFNFDTPWHPDDYVHRIGRTGRAGAKGRAFTFVTPEDREAIANVEKLTGAQIPVYELSGQGGPTDEAQPEPKKRPRKKTRSSAGKPDRPEQNLQDDKLPDDGWNGPVPQFLNVSAV
ncbi:MAG: DEAD/DEAH box helicase [Sphingomonadaceae bacterium]